MGRKVCKPVVTQRLAPISCLLVGKSHHLSSVLFPQIQDGVEVHGPFVTFFLTSGFPDCLQPLSNQWLVKWDQRYPELPQRNKAKTFKPSMGSLL